MTTHHASLLSGYQGLSEERWLYITIATEQSARSLAWHAHLRQPLVVRPAECGNPSGRPLHERCLRGNCRLPALLRGGGLRRTSLRVGNSNRVSIMPAATNLTQRASCCTKPYVNMSSGIPTCLSLLPLDSQPGAQPSCESTS